MGDKMILLSPQRVIKRLEDNVIFYFKNKNIKPVLCLIISENAEPPEESYLKSLVAASEKYGVKCSVHRVANAIEAGQTIIELKSSIEVCGIMVLSHFGLEDQAIYNLVPIRLDIDCSSSNALGALMVDRSEIGYRRAPGAAVAAIKILEDENIDFAGKKAAVLGRSLRVSRPLAEILCQKNATVTIFHSKSKSIDLSDYDIVVSAIGQAKVVNPSWWSCRGKTKYIIDIGINLDENNKLCGDVDIDKFAEYDDLKVTPVPGCVGPIATACIFAKLYQNAAILYGELDV